MARFASARGHFGSTLDPAGTAPLLCARITTYSLLRHWKVGKGKKVGIVGLGRMGVKFAKAFGGHVVLFTTSVNKTADAKRLGADEVVVSKNESEMQKQVASFDFILDAVSANHDLNAYPEFSKARWHSRADWGRRKIRCLSVRSGS